MGYKTIKSGLLFIVLASLFAACTNGGKEASTVYEAVGVVKAIPDSKSHVNIEHEKIDGFMEAMQMFFPVKDSTVLTGIAPADSIRFVIEVTGGNYLVTSIDKMNQGSGAP